MTPQSLHESFLITSELDVWQVLAKLLSDDAPNASVEFQQWPQFELIIKGQRYAGTIPATLMSKLSMLQKELNTEYGKFVHDGDARNIKKYERDDLELVYEVKKSSTEIKADATGFLNKLGEALSKQNTQKVAGITLCVLALIISGNNAIEVISNNSRTVEVEKLKLLNKALEVVPNLKSTTKEFQELFKGIVTSALDAESMSIGSQQFSEAEIAKLSERQRGRIEKVELAGNYYISSIRRYRNYYLIEIRLNGTDSLRAKVLHKDFGENVIDRLMKAFVTNTPVQLSVVAVKHEDGFANGQVVAIDA
jgi:hypothetical protein